MLRLIAMMLMTMPVLALGQTVNLPVPNVTGHACGALTGVATVVGFDTNGNIQATFTEKTVCSGSGRDPHPTTYYGSGVLTWDFRGGVVLGYNATLAIAGNTDQYGNTVVNHPAPFFGGLLTIAQMPPNPVYVEALVPNVIGNTSAAGQAALVAAGLTSYEYINATYPAPAGTVFNQIPRGGALEPFGTAIALWGTPAASSGGGDD
jgi:hypothetical protein